MDAAAGAVPFRRRRPEEPAMKRSLTAAATAATLLTCGAVAVSLALAARGGSGTTDFGPYVAKNRADTGSCGNTWAHGKQTQTYRVFPRDPDGQYTVEAQVTSSERTVAGRSVGACNVDGGTNGTVG